MTFASSAVSPRNLQLSQEKMPAPQNKSLSSNVFAGVFFGALGQECADAFHEVQLPKVIKETGFTFTTPFVHVFLQTFRALVDIKQEIHHSLLTLNICWTKGMWEQPNRALVKGGWPSVLLIESPKMYVIWVLGIYICFSNISFFWGEGPPWKLEYNNQCVAAVGT